MKRRVPTLRLAPMLAGAAMAVTAVIATVPAGATAQQHVYVRQASPAWLGVSYELRWIQEGDTCSPQVVVEAVIQGSPAERAGIRAGDAILALNGNPVPAGHLSAMASRLSPGDSVRLRFLRDGEPREAMAVADRRPDRPLQIFVERTSGLRTTTLPVIERVGEMLVARNVGTSWNADRARGYYVLQPNGEAEYHVLGRWSHSELDREVTELLACAGQTQLRSEAWVTPTTRGSDIRDIQARADSLRVILAQRALERSDVEGVGGVVTRIRANADREPGAVRVTIPDGAFSFRIEEHVAVGMRAIAGAEFTVMEPELAEYFRNVDQGLLVLRIAPDTPAERAGLRPGDVVVAADGRRVESVDELREIVALPTGDIQLRVIRQGRTRDLTLSRN